MVQALSKGGLRKLSEWVPQRKSGPMMASNLREHVVDVSKVS